MEVEKLRLEQIRPSDLNNEIYTPIHEDRLRKLANDIKRNGLLEPILVTIDGVIISGHTRFAALKMLGRKFVEVRRFPVYSHSPEFPELLVSANNQRVKTERERINEIVVTVDPAGYSQKRLERANWGSIIDLAPVEGVLKSSRGLSGNYEALANAVLKVVNENTEYLPLTLRRVHYLLLNNPPVLSKRSGLRYDNRREHYQTLSVVVTKMRIAGTIPFHWLFDGTRILNTNRGWLDVESYLENELNGLFSTYSRDLLQSQPHYTAIICEKETVGPLLNRIAGEWGVPVVYSKGGSSIDIRYRLLMDWERNGGKPIQLLILSDLDPAGYRIQNSFVGSLKSDFAEWVKDTPIRAFRVGITPDQVKRYGLHSDMSAKETDKNYMDFVRETGLQTAYEIDALPPKIFIEEVENALKKVIDLALYEEEVDQYNEDIERIERKRLEVLNAL
jgi:hypothetical protein